MSQFDERLYLIPKVIDDLDVINMSKYELAKEVIRLTKVNNELAQALREAEDDLDRGQL